MRRISSLQDLCVHVLILSPPRSNNGRPTEGTHLWDESAVRSSTTGEKSHDLLICVWQHSVNRCSNKLFQQQWPRGQTINHNQPWPIIIFSSKCWEFILSSSSHFGNTGWYDSKSLLTYMELQFHDIFIRWFGKKSQGSNTGEGDINKWNLFVFFYVYQTKIIGLGQGRLESENDAIFSMVSLLTDR